MGWRFSAAAEVRTPSPPGDSYVDRSKTDAFARKRKERRCDFTIKQKLNIVTKVCVIKVWEEVMT